MLPVNQWISAAFEIGQKILSSNAKLFQRANSNIKLHFMWQQEAEKPLEQKQLPRNLGGNQSLQKLKGSGSTEQNRRTEQLEWSLMLVHMERLMSRVNPGVPHCRLHLVPHSTLQDCRWAKETLLNPSEPSGIMKHKVRLGHTALVSLQVEPETWKNLCKLQWDNLSK